MQSGFLNCLVSAFIGAVASIAVSWYMSANASNLPNGEDAIAQTVKARRIEAESLVVGRSILLVDPETKEPLLEIRDGSVFAQNALYADRVGAYTVRSQKLQTTADDPINPNARPTGELAVDAEGGAYLDLVGPQRSHSVTIGFDASDKGFVVSQNNNDKSRVAQAVFQRPTRRGENRIAPTSATTRQ